MNCIVSRLGGSFGDALCYTAHTGWVSASSCVYRTRGRTEYCAQPKFQVEDACRERGGIRSCVLLSRAFGHGLFASPGNSHSRGFAAPCDSRRSASLHRPLGALGSGPTGRGRLRPPNPARDFSPGNLHSRDASVAPCDFRRSACLHPAQRAAGSDPLDPSSLRAYGSWFLGLFPSSASYSAFHFPATMGHAYAPACATHRAERSA